MDKLPECAVQYSALPQSDEKNQISWYITILWDENCLTVNSGHRACMWFTTVDTATHWSSTLTLFLPKRIKSIAERQNGYENYLRPCELHTRVQDNPVAMSMNSVITAKLRAWFWNTWIRLEIPLHPRSPNEGAIIPIWAENCSLLRHSTQVRSYTQYTHRQECCINNYRNFGIGVQKFRHYLPRWWSKAKKSCPFSYNNAAIT